MIVLLNFCDISSSIEVPCIKRNDNECEVDPSVCSKLNDENTAEDKVIIPSYENVKDCISLDILSPTNLTTIPRFVFRKFAKLEQIRMINTGITKLNADSFFAGHNLVQIDLRRNQITDITEKTFDGLYYLEHINFAYNNITRINRHIFDNALALESVIFSNNLLETIEADCFSGAAKLSELNFEMNEIRNIEENAFNLSKLKIISLKGNQLISIPNGLFTNAPKLERIDLSDNDLTEIGDSFNGMKKLYSLSLSDNSKLSDSDLFRLIQQIPNLSYLYLAKTGFKLTNKISNGLNDNSNEPNYALTHLDLSRNDLKTIVLNNNRFTYLNHIALLKSVFPRLSTIQLKYNKQIDLNWLRHAQLVLQKQKIKLVTEHKLN